MEIRGAVAVCNGSFVLDIYAIIIFFLGGVFFFGGYFFGGVFFWGGIFLVFFWYFFGIFLVFFGIFWYFLVFFGIFWYFLVFFGIFWYFLVFFGVVAVAVQRLYGYEITNFPMDWYPCPRTCTVYNPSDNFDNCNITWLLPFTPFICVV